MIFAKVSSKNNVWIKYEILKIIDFADDLTNYRNKSTFNKKMSHQHLNNTDAKNNTEKNVGSKNTRKEQTKEFKNHR